MTAIYSVVSNLEFCFCFKILSRHYLTQAVSQPGDSPSAETAGVHSTWFLSVYRRIWGGCHSKTVHMLLWEGLEGLWVSNTDQIPKSVTHGF